MELAKQVVVGQGEGMSVEVCRCLGFQSSLSSYRSIALQLQFFFMEKKLFSFFFVLWQDVSSLMVSLVKLVRSLAASAFEVCFYIL